MIKTQSSTYGPKDDISKEFEVVTFLTSYNMPDFAQDAPFCASGNMETN